MEIVGFDLDGTLRDHSHRRWMLEKILAGEDGYTWADYSRASTDDVPVPAARELMRLLMQHYSIYVMSAAEDVPENHAWLAEHNFPYDKCLFRQRGDHTDSAMLKVRWIKDLRMRGHNVRLYVEDFAEIAEVIERETGVPCLVVTPRHENVPLQHGRVTRQ